MKKALALILALVTALTAVCFLASCGKKENDDKGNTGRKNGTLVVAMSPDFAPMEFYDTSKSGNDAIVGFDVILANFLAKELDKDILIKPMDFDACMAAVQSKSVDIAISGFSWTASRAETFLITDYYIAGENETEQTVITTKANAGKLTDVASFKDLKVAAQGGSLQQLLVEEQLVPAGATLVKFASTTDCISALKNGQVDAFAVAKGNGDAFISQNKDTVDFSGFNFEVAEKYKNNVCLVNKNDKELYDAVNLALKKAMENNVYDTWYNACKAYAGVTTVDENGFDEDGNKIIEKDADGNPVIDGQIVKVDATSEDALKKVAYEQIIADLKK